MRPGAGQINFIPSDPVNQEPIWFDVRVAIALPIPFQRMVFVARRQLFAGDEQLQKTPQLSQIFASLFRTLNISPKLSGSDRRQHLRRPNP
jgi:hypothetical protein